MPSTQKSKWLKIKECFCKYFGHSFDNVELLMFDISKTAINANKLDPKIKCQRCGVIFD